MSQFWFWLLAPGSTYFVVRVVQHPGFLLTLLLVLLVGGCFVFTQPEQSGKAVHDLFADSSSTPTSSATATSTPARDSGTGTAPSAWQCPDGDVCFWSGPDGTGSLCKWDVTDPDWRSGDIVCSWSEGDEVRSVFNNSHSPDAPDVAVLYYKRTNFHARVGCVEPGQQSNLPATSRVRSHRLAIGSCAENA